MHFTLHSKWKRYGTVLDDILNWVLLDDYTFLKDLSDICLKTTRLTFHIDRHTFTLITIDWRSIDSVSSMLGYRGIKAAEHTTTDLR